MVHGVAKSRTRLSDSLTHSAGSSSHLAVGGDGAVLQNTGSGSFKGALSPLWMGVGYLAEGSSLGSGFGGRGAPRVWGSPSDPSSLLALSA